MKHKKRIIKIGIAGTLVIGFFVAWYYGQGDVNEWAAKIDGVRKEARAAGISLKPIVSEGRSARGAAQNPMSAFKAAITAVESAGGNFDLDLVNGDEALRTSLEKYDDAINSWMLASTFENAFRVPGPDGTLESVASTDAKFAATLLLADARLARTDGDYESWSARLEAVLALSLLMGEYPDSMMQSCSWNMSEALADEVGAALVDSGNIEAISSWPTESLPTTIGTDLFEHYVMIEAAMARQYIAIMESHSFFDRLKMAGPQESTFDYPYHPHAAEANEAVWLTYHIQVLRAVTNNQSDWAAVIDHLPDLDELLDRAGPRAGAITRQFTVNFRKVVGSWVEEETKRRILVVAARIFQYRIAFGEYPESLPDLGTGSIDPFSGKPLNYSSLGVGFHVYSVGADRMDSGGVRTDGLGTASDSDDLGFRMSGWPAKSSN